jgi:hypothetical protein
VRHDVADAGLLPELELLTPVVLVAVPGDNATVANVDEACLGAGSHDQERRRDQPAARRASVMPAARSPADIQCLALYVLAEGKVLRGFMVRRSRPG